MINRIRCIDIGFFERRAGLLIFIYILLALLPAILVFAVIDGLPEDLSIFLAKGMALVALGLLNMQVILGSRFHIADSGFGLDKVIAFHRKMALLALALMILHPILLAVGYSDFSIIYSMSMGIFVTIGRITLLLFIIVLLSALYYAKLKIDYNVWRFMHKSAIFVVVAAFIHGFISRYSMEGRNLLWFLPFIIAIGVFTYRNAIRPFIARKKYIIKAVKQETSDVTTLVLKPQTSEIALHKPGQFVFLKLCLKRCEEHPFTIASASDDTGEISVTIKESGDYTKHISRAKEGDEVLVDGPYGRFSFIYDQPESFVFIAGGVGITPIMAMIRYLRDTGDKRKVLLLYANKTEDDIIFRKELDMLAENFTVVHCFSRQGDWQGCTGRLDVEKIKELSGELFDSSDFYICGPPAMMNSIIEGLREARIEKLHFEKFSIN